MRLLVLLIIVPLSLPILAENLRFGVVPKEQWSDFFLASKKGCEAAARELGVKCVFQGPDSDDLRKQDQIISQLVDSGVHGIAVAVTHSEYLSKHSIKHANEQNIPVITYDSDFDPHTLAEFPKIRHAYIGTNNVDLGRAAGRIVKQLRPKGGRLCIQSGREDQTNMRQRIAGLRSELAGETYKTPPGERLINANGWTEMEDCPLYTLGNYDTALRHFKWALHMPYTEVDTFVSVGGWIQYKKSAYLETIAPYESQIRNNKKIIVISDSEQVQLGILKAGMAHGNFGQNPFEMGRQAIYTLYKIHHGQPYDKVIHTPIPECTQSNYEICTKP